MIAMKYRCREPTSLPEGVISRPTVSASISALSAAATTSFEGCFGARRGQSLRFLTN